jgi:hypothetical protein
MLRTFFVQAGSSADDPDQLSSSVAPDSSPLIATEFSARCLAARRSETGGNGQQRKMSWWSTLAFASISFVWPMPPNKENPHEAAFGLSEDARPGRH